MKIELSLSQPHIWPVTIHLGIDGDTLYVDHISLPSKLTQLDDLIELRGAIEIAIAFIKGNHLIPLNIYRKTESRLQFLNIELRKENE